MTMYKNTTLFPCVERDSIAFIDGKRPGTTEADHHNNFKNIHNNFLISYPRWVFTGSLSCSGDINNFIHTPGTVTLKIKSRVHKAQLFEFFINRVHQVRIKKFICVPPAIPLSGQYHRDGGLSPAGTPGPAETAPPDL